MKLFLFLLFGALVGFCGCFIPWGAENRLHGIGLPVAVVLWDVKDGSLIDYPNPLAYVINPVLGLLVSGLIYGILSLASLRVSAPRH